MSDYLDINNEELLKDFFSEAEQQVEILESNVLVIEQNPEDRNAVDEIFRAAHTLKGGSATVEMTELSQFTHAMEDLLDEIRSGTVKVTGETVDLLLKSIDIIKLMLDARASGSIYSDDVSGVVNQLRSYIPQKADKKAGKSSAPKVSIPASSPPATAPKMQASASSLDVKDYFSEYELLELAETIQKGEELYAVIVKFDESNLMNSVGGIQVFAALKDYGSVLKTVPDFDALYEDEFHETVIYFLSSATDKNILEKAAFIGDVTLSASAEKLEVKNEAHKAPVPVQTASETSSQASAPVTKAPEKTEEKAAVETGEALSKPVEKSEKKQTQTASQGSGHSSSGSILRVDANRIDYLLNLVSETVITKASLNQSSIEFTELYDKFQNSSTVYKDKTRKLLDKIPDYLEKIQQGYDINSIKQDVLNEYSGLIEIFGDFDSSMKAAVTKFKSSSQNLGRISGELQEGVMKIRMVPISQIFSRFPRVVRDLSRDLNKNVQLVIEGEDTELDKSVVEDLLDPIMHCVRNSLDHGVESPEVRKSLGKSEQGILLLKASNEGNMIVIEVADDGHGIDVEAVKQKAVERGILHPNKNLTDIEAFQLVFAPGFSTSKTISSVSGRGVGLDVVKTHIEKLNGTVMVESEPNVGTRFIIKLPLTLAIIQGLLIRVGDEVYSIPITSVIESHRVKPDEINRIDNYEVFNVRDEVYSLLRLNRLFGITSAETDDDGYNYIVVVGTEEKKVGLMVDSLIGEESVVIKPLKDQFTNSPGIAGASILGDGSVSLIIDVAQLLELGLKQEMQARERREASIW
ncbi:MULTISPECIES: chemotaxis protein CheA [unclassified Treponema]|uniref:chemotaxis protein CheA n=1 Tax=unclassified Treponema TaxID=2638727 RepID=UPI0020A5D022|nr:MULTISPECIES: chemotaxis protein CheA [unclassified Treponema]UTC68137.1 chemotaxis protein CheA [Treponema sp. OMZ 789]UTC70859.1 chemotaxis protein CheA [Treponema sp. OMZ 790]UTC73599.1 chemotaxis protein CheA [Treponema sp. OMZ 791]